MDKEELAEELDHQRQMVKELRRRRRLLERNHVIKGIETDPHILMQIEDIGRQIKEREAEIEHLQTLAVEDKIPLAEAEYRSALAFAWDAGRLTSIGSTSLELTRLQLGISLDKAQLLEKDIRKSIAGDKLAEQDRDEIILQVREQLSYIHSSGTDNREELLKGICQGVFAHLSRLQKAIDLDTERVVDWMNEDVQLAFTLDEIDMLIHIGTRHKAANSGCKLARFLNFLDLLRQALHP